VGLLLMLTGKFTSLEELMEDVDVATIVDLYADKPE
jgi:hypothetical protein